MTNEEAVKILKNEYLCRINIKDGCYPWGCRNCEYSEDKDDVTQAINYAVQALSKQSASSEQVDKSVIVDFVAFQREWLNSHKTLELDAVNNALVNIFLKTTGKAFIDSLGQSAENDEDRTRDDEGPKLFGKRTIIEPGEEFIGEDLLKEALDQSADSDKMVDQFRDDTKKTDFKPGDKFILELGTERKMFGEFEIAGTDLYVKTDLLEKLTRYEPGENPGNLGENPGIIRCNACKYWIQTVGRMQGYGLGKCDFHDANLVNCNGFCYWAERRNDG